MKLTGVELSPEMAELGRRHAEELGREIDLRVGDAESLDFPDESFDTVVCTYGLCTIPDDRAAISEARRVLRPGGRILLAEHVRSPNRIVRAIQRVLDPLAHRFGGDHLLREPLEPLAERGLRGRGGQALEGGVRRAGLGTKACLAGSTCARRARCGTTPRSMRRIAAVIPRPMSGSATYRLAATSIALATTARLT